MDQDNAKQRFLDKLDRPWMADEIFDAVPDCVFFIKDSEGRYVAVNQALVERCGKSSKSELVGKTAREVFPTPLGASFTEQDFEVIREGRAIRGQLELHLYPNSSQGWCLTWKEPVVDVAGKTIGVSGISRDISQRSETSQDFEGVAAVLDYIDSNLEESMRLDDLAEKAGLSGFQFDQRIRGLFGLSVGQYITRKRIELACHLLDRTDESIGLIALDCGYGDQSSFTRQFRQSVGITPGAFRDRRNSTK